MEQLTPEGQRVAAELSQQFGFSQEAVIQMMRAMLHGRSAMAQFNHPEFAGSGQWMRGGMLMLGDMFNHALKARVDGLCHAIAAQLANQPDLFPSGSFQSQNQSGGGQQLQTGGRGQQMQVGGGGQQMQVSGGGGMALGFTPLSPLASPADGSHGLFAPDPRDLWWPKELGTPSSIGAQNDVRYAFFPTIGRLAIDTNGQVSIYDTGEHHIAGLSQQQGPGGNVVFTTPAGSVSLAGLSSVAGGPFQQAQSTAGSSQQQQQLNSGLAPMGGMKPIGGMAPMEGMAPMSFAPMAPVETWWPPELGSPSSSGSQNNLRYAVFPVARCLAVEVNGGVSVHDIGDLQILGCSLASGDAEALFNTNSGTIKLSSLPLVQPASPAASHGHASPSVGSPDSVPPRAIQQTQTAAPEPLASLDPAAAPAPVQAAAEHQYPQSAVLEALAKLGDLKAMGILTEAEFTAKKTELLGRL
jgi:hypothetical protein